MSILSRRRFLGASGSSALALGLRSAITGLPLSFLLHGRANGQEAGSKIAILAASGAGEPVNVGGPGTFDPEALEFFQHPIAAEVDAGDVGTVMVNGQTLDASDLEASTEVLLGPQVVRMARAYGALPDALRDHLTWFYYRTGAGIHPEFPAVITAHGSLHAEDGRGTEQVFAGIAQETAPLLNTVTADPFVLGGGDFSSRGAPLARYSPTEVKALAMSAGNGGVDPNNFAVMYDYLIDEAYGEVKAKGTPAQRRFFDQQASSREKAASFGQSLGQMLVDIVDDTIESQLKTALILAKLRLAPTIITGYALGGDNHSDADLTQESAETLQMVKALDTYWKNAGDLGVLDDVVFATVDVFGRGCRRGVKGGRGHHGDMTAGLVLGAHLQGGVVGGITTESGTARASGIHSATGGATDADVAPEDTLRSYYKTLLRVAGVPAERREVRIPTGTEVTSQG